MTSIAYFIFFFFNDTATTEIYTLSLHDALPIWRPREWGVRGDRTRYGRRQRSPRAPVAPAARGLHAGAAQRDRKSTRLNSSHANISYAVFCLKKKKKRKKHRNERSEYNTRMNI